MATLIERLEKATGPDRRLDIEISFEVDGFNRVHFSEVFAQATNGDLPPFDEELWPLYTKSIDAALTLVPDGWDWSVGNLVGHGIAARIGGPAGEEGEADYSKDRTPALALCIAALKARMSGGEGEKAK